MQEYKKPIYDEIMTNFLNEFHEGNPFRVCPQCGMQTVQVSADVTIYCRAASCLCCGFYTHKTAAFDAKGAFRFDGNDQVIVDRLLKYGYGVWSRLSTDGQRRDSGVFSEFTPFEFKRMFAQEIVDDPSWDHKRSYVTDADPTRPSGSELGYGTYRDFLLGNYKQITWGSDWARNYVFGNGTHLVAQSQTDLTIVFQRK